MLEVVPQHIHVEEGGIPAYKSGEWPGIRPNHFLGSKLILKPIKKPEKEFKLGHSVHFPARYSEEYKFRPIRRKLNPLEHSNIYRPSKRIIVPVYTEPNVYPPHISDNHPMDQLNSNDIYPLFQKKMKIIDKPVRDYANAINEDNNEYYVEDIMNKKQRVNCLSQEPNSKIHHNPGDKPYKIVDNSKDFFKEGGLIVGSTNRINYNKTMKKGEDNFYQTLDLSVKILDQKKVWDNKVIAENKENDKNYVANLTKFDKNTFGEEDSEDETK